jgi:ferredoxin
MPTVLVNDNSYIVDAGKILYDQLESQNMILPHGCLAGSCGACRVEIISGAKNLSALGAVELDTLSHFESGDIIIRLACRAKVLGDIKISY